MKRYAYYLNGTEYTLEPNGPIIGHVACATEEQARAMVEYMHVLNPIILEEPDELSDNG